MEETLWHAQSITQTFERIGSKKTGLTNQEAKRRLQKFGQNKLVEKKQLSGLVILLSQFKSPLVYVLLIAALISAVLRDFVDTGVILMAVVVNTVLGFYQEYKANRAIHLLRQLVNYNARVLRDGNEIEISSTQVVPGDIIMLRPGYKIPADARLVDVDNLQVIEASLTGESVPSDKSTLPLDRGTALADRENMIYSGTVVAQGRGQAVVCATGASTQIGIISKLINETAEEATPLQRHLAKFSRTLTWIIVAVSFILMLIGRLQGRPIFGHGEGVREGMLNTAVALSVAAIPEGLLIAVTATLAIGMQAILRRKALVRRLMAAETLGSVSVICTDKTGTLTEGKMQVAKIITANEELNPDQAVYTSTAKLKDYELILKISALCNDAVIENEEKGLEEWKILGSPTEAALLLSALQAGISQKEMEKQQPRLMELPFDSELKYMATLNTLSRTQNVIYAKGAPERILDKCTKIRLGSAKKPLSQKRRQLLQANYEKLTSRGYRVLAFAYRQIPSTKKIQSLNDNLEELIFVGFAALKDPLRKEAKSTIQLVKQAGIHTVVVTGDHQLTAKAIVRELGLPVSDNQMMTGEQLDSVSDEELLKIIQRITIFARVEPKHKIRIVKAWQELGEIVAMTGDGVNDAAALKAADIGIALGSGTDVAKETSDMILLDDNFSTIVAAVERGRVIFENIKKVVLYLLVSSFSEMVLIIGALMLLLPLPILPAQILWINLITDGFPSLALPFEGGEREVMKDKPRKKGQVLLDKEMRTLIFVIGIITDVVLLALFIAFLNLTSFSVPYIRTVIFAGLSTSALLYVFSCRSFRRSILQINFFSNKILLGAVGLGFGLLLLGVYEPHLQVILDTTPLKAIHWPLIIGLGLIKLLAVEVCKYYFNVKRKSAAAPATA